MYATVKVKLLKKVLIDVFAFRPIQNDETDFKIQSYQKTSYLGSQLPSFNPKISINSANRPLTLLVLNKNQERKNEYLNRARE